MLFKVGLGLLYSVMPSIQLTPAVRVGAVLMCLGGPAARLISHREKEKTPPAIDFAVQFLCLCICSFAMVTFLRPPSPCSGF